MGYGVGGLVMDVRGFDPTLRRAVLFCVVDKFVELGCREQIVFICDHEPAGIGYQLDLRRESRGCFEIEYEQRTDGAWVALIRPKAAQRSRSAQATT